MQLDIADGRVTEARVNAPMFRGFEHMLTGRDPMDALVIVPRICGICSVSQSVAAAAALADAVGVAMPPNGVHAINLMLACENLADHLTHFYLFFMPDFTRPVYAGRPWFRRRPAALCGLGGSTSGGAAQPRGAGRARRWFELIGTLGGKWPHTRRPAARGSVARHRGHRAHAPAGPGARVARLSGANRCSAHRWKKWPARQPGRPAGAGARRAAGSDLALFLDWPTTPRLARLGRARAAT